MPCPAAAGSLIPVLLESSIRRTLPRVDSEDGSYGSGAETPKRSVDRHRGALLAPRWTATEGCIAVDLSRLPPFTEDALVEQAVALELHRSELRSVWAAAADGSDGKQWCAQAIFTDSGRRRAREFATTRATDPLEDILVLFVGGQAVQVVLRGELRTGPTLGCFDSLDEFKRALSAIGPIDTD